MKINEYILYMEQDVDWKCMINILTVKRLELLNICQRQGHLLQEDALEIYEHRPAVSNAVSELVENGLLEQKEAPEISTLDNVYELTEKGKIFTN